VCVSDLRRTYPISPWQSGGGSPESRFPTSPLLALPAKEILCRVTNGRGQCAGEVPSIFPAAASPTPPPPFHLHHRILERRRRRRVLPDDHNCVLKPLIKFLSLE